MFSADLEEEPQNSNQKIDVLCSNLLFMFKQHIANKEYIEANQLLVYFYEAKEKTKDENIGYRNIEDKFDDRCL